MKKYFCIILLLTAAIAVFPQSAPKFGESMLFLNKEKAKTLMKESGFKNVETKTMCCEELDNSLCDIISGTSDWCGMCHVYFKKGEVNPSFLNINLVTYANNYTAVNDWKNAGYVILKSMPSENSHLLIRDRKGQKYSFIARVQILSTSDGTITNTKILKMLTPQ